MDMFVAVLNGNEIEKIYPIVDEETVIGRSKTCDITLPSMLLSAKHARIVVNIDGMFLENLSGKNDILYKDVYSSKIAIANNQEVGLGIYKLQFLYAHNRDEVVEHIDNHSKLNDVVDGVLIDNEITIGRDFTCDLRLNYPFVSKRHIKITSNHNNQIFVEDLRSKNGTCLNGKKIYKSVEYNDGDIISVDSIELKIVNNSVFLVNDPEDLVFSTKNLSFVTKKKVIINQVSFEAKGGELIAVVGGSGEGKSTLLKLLSGYLKPTNGELFYNNIPFENNFKYIKEELGFVHQDDIIYPELTLYKNLYYAAKLRLPEHVDSAQVNELINKTVELVDLTEFKHKKVGTLSGGQRKRSAIAIEILMNPNMIFLDEPTSGLDNYLKTSLTKLFRAIANRNKIVFVATHDVEDLDIYDKVLIVSAGELIYYGEPKKLKILYDIENYSDIYSKTRNLKTSSKYTFSKPIPVEEEVVETNTSKKINVPQKSTFISHLFVLTARYIEILKNSPVTLMLWLIQAPIIAVFLGIVFVNVNNFYMLSFVIAVSTLWYGANNSVKEIVKNDKYYIKDRHSSLNLASYVLSIFIVVSLITILENLLFVAVLDIFVRLPISFLDLFMYSSLISILGIGLGLLISAISDNSDKALISLPLVLIPQLILSGVLVEFDKMSSIARYIADFTPLRWSFEYLNKIMVWNDNRFVEFFGIVLVFVTIFIIFIFVLQKRKDKWSI